METLNMEITEIYGIQTIKEETFIQGTTDRGDVTLKFKTIELLDWINIKTLKTEAHKYIETL